jgi:ABC-2 type transport system permease protein
MFFLAGALFPLTGNLPAWLLVLTRLDPASYGIDALRRIVLTMSGVPSQVVHGFEVTLFGWTVSLWVELVVLVAFGLLMMSLAVYGFRQRD